LLLIVKPFLFFKKRLVFSAGVHVTV
jgi:hypothetical protein